MEINVACYPGPLIDFEKSYVEQIAYVYIVVDQGILQ